MRYSAYAAMVILRRERALPLELASTQSHSFRNLVLQQG